MFHSRVNVWVVQNCQRNSECARNAFEWGSRLAQGDMSSMETAESFESARALWGCGTFDSARHGVFHSQLELDSNAISESTIAIR